MDYMASYYLAGHAEHQRHYQAALLLVDDQIKEKLRYVR